MVYYKSSNSFPGPISTVLTCDFKVVPLKAWLQLKKKKYLIVYFVIFEHTSIYQYVLLQKLFVCSCSPAEQFSNSCTLHTIAPSGGLKRELHLKKSVVGLYSYGVQLCSLGDSIAAGRAAVGYRNPKLDYCKSLKLYIILLSTILHWSSFEALGPHWPHYLHPHPTAPMKQWSWLLLVMTVVMTTMRWRRGERGK